MQLFPPFPKPLLQDDQGHGYALHTITQCFPYTGLFFNLVSLYLACHITVPLPHSLLLWTASPEGEKAVAREMDLWSMAVAA